MSNAVWTALSVSYGELPAFTDSLSDRRSINRRSAQKHRLRRKEELETLSRQLAERDAKIALLEKDLAVTRAQLQQLISIMGPRLAASATAAPAAGAEKK
jgi:hypothetical protein